MHYKHKNLLGTFLLGAAAGWVASMLIPPSTRRNMREAVQDKTKALRQAFTDPEERARIKELFQDKTSRTQEMFLDVKEAVVDKFAAMRDSFADIDKAKYSQIVEETLDELQRESVIAKDQLAKLKDYLEKDFRKVKSRFSQASFNNEDVFEV